ncbi:MAG: hypothetical protein U0573_09485 [Phycisphaerales bacterium]|nr:hypothetical protein [Planctomycetota bacterium]
MPPRFPLHLWLSIVCLLLTACSPAKKAVTVQTEVESPGAYGLELRLWPIDNPPASLARALTGFDQSASPIDRKSFERLSASGLRALVVPASDLDEIASRLHFDGKIEKQSARERSDWSVFVAGKAWSGYVTLRTADGNLALRAGQLRLVGRAWIAPGAMGEDKIPAVLRIELAGRHVESRDSYGKLEEILNPAVQRPGDLQGLALPSLGLSIELQAGQALLLIPEDPDLDWDKAARLPNYIEKEPEKNEQEAQSQLVGPAIPKTATLGQALLSDALTEFEPRHRAILVLVPRLPAEFRLVK